MTSIIELLDMHTFHDSEAVNHAPGKSNWRHLHERPPGLYLHMRHGRRSVDEKLEDWGMEGPWIGPLVWACISHLSDINLCFTDGSLTDPLGSSDPLHFTGPMLFYEGVYYSDWDLSLVEESGHD